MSLIFSPLTEDILEGPFQPYPRGAFLMLQDNEGTPEVDKEIERIIEKTLNDENFHSLKATTKRGTKDFLEKIVQLIRGAGFGVAIFSQHTGAISLANIFFEVGLCNLLGKPVIIVKNDGATAPSDFVRTEWVTYLNNQNQLEQDFKKSINSLEELANYFEGLGDLAFEAEDRDLELAFERYKQAVLITGKPEIRNKIKQLLYNVDTKKDGIGLEASRKRLKTAIRELEIFLAKN